MPSIPVANIYYLLCYAWNEFAPRQIERHAAEEFPDTLHLFSRQLIIGLQSLHRSGLETGYIAVEESTSTPRGRILIASSIRTMTMQPKRLYCTFDEMSADVQSNQILKATLNRLLGVHELEPSVRRELRQASALLRDVHDVELSARLFHAVRLHQNNRLYSFLLTICRFLFECMEAQDRPGQYRFREVDRDEKRMRRVFERFVLNFFARRQKAFKVKSERMDWFASAAEGSDPNLLPEMATDASLRSSRRTIIASANIRRSCSIVVLVPRNCDQSTCINCVPICAIWNITRRRQIELRKESCCTRPSAGCLTWRTVFTAIGSGFVLLTLTCRGRRLKIKCWS